MSKPNEELPTASKLHVSRRFHILRPLEIAPDPDKKGSYYYYTDDHVRGLVSDLGRCSSSSTRRRAAKKLRKLAKHSPENRLRIAGLGAVEALVSTLVHLELQISSDDEDDQRNSAAEPIFDAELQEHAVTALYNLSLQDANLLLIPSSEAVTPTINILASPCATPAAKSGATCLLLRLAQGDVENSYMLEDIGNRAIPPLVDILRTGDLRGQKDAATALYELMSRWLPNRQRAARAGIVPALLELMEDPGSCMVEKAAYVLSTVVAECGEAKEDVVECGGVEALVEMLELGTRVQKEIAVNVLLSMCDADGGKVEDEQEAEYYRRVVAEEEGALPGLHAVADPISGCSSKSRGKAKVLLDMLVSWDGTARVNE